MNNTNHYFGAFLVIQVKEKIFNVEQSMCPRGHKDSGPFCRTCGLPVTVKSAQIKEYPTQIYQLLTEDETLSVITPIYMFGTNTIIARANSNAGAWMVINRDTRGEPVRKFPTESEINAFMDALSNLPAVQALRAHPDVVSVSVEAGHVEDARL